MVGLMFGRIGQLSKAEEWYKRILEQQPCAAVFYELGYICKRTNRLLQAVQYRRKAVEADPDNIQFRTTLAVDLIQAGQTQEGIDLLRKMVEVEPGNADIHSKLLFHLHYLPEQNPQMLLEEHKRWGQIHAPMSMAKQSHDNIPDPDRRLRVGYISADFRMHSVAYNFEAFLSGCNQQAVEVYGYGNVASPDKMTEHLKQKFDHYRDIYNLGDKEVAHLIEQDRIDILVVIGGHTGDNRLLVMAYKPAPVQVDYGGPSTSGMEQIDYRLTDSLLNAPESEKFHTEELVYLPGGLLCYTPPQTSPAVASLPARRNGHITFGSFNNNLKINSRIMELWARILKANNSSHFLMKFRGGYDQGVRDYYFGQFEQLGIRRERVQIHGWKSSAEHLQLYNQVDIALDTYPYNGWITTLEGFWMGVPAVSLVDKDQFISGAGLSIFSRIGLEFFAASTPEEYVAKATALAQKPDALAKIRASMRQRMLGSTLCDAKAYTANIEAAYREMWHRWCRSHGTAGGRADCSYKSTQETVSLSEQI